MARKPKAGRKKGAPEEKPVKPQAERFKEAARQAEADETGNAFERAFRKIVPPRLRTTKRQDGSP